VNENPEQWHGDLLDREENPEEFSGPRSIRGDLGDKAREKGGEYIKDKAELAAKKYGKKAGQELGKTAAKEAAKQGAKSAAQAGATSAASGTAAGAAAGSVAPVVGTAIGAAAGAALSKARKNKTFRNILISAAILFGFGGIFILVSLVVMAPVVIMTAVANSPAGQAVELVYDTRGALISTATLGPKLAATGLEAGKDLADEGAGWVEDHSPIDIPLFGAVSTPHDPNSTQVLAAQTISKDSRLYQLTEKMEEKGFFKDLKQKYKINIVTTARFKFDIFLDGKKLHHANSVADALQFMAKDERIQDRLMYVMDAEHIYGYGKRVTFAESGMADYQSSRLYIPNADKAKSDQQVTDVKRSTVDTVNTPFFAQAQDELDCTDCGSWVPTTVAGDQDTVTTEISAETGFQPKNTLFSVMNTRVTKEDSLSDEQILEWFNYVRELQRASRVSDEEAKTDEFVQGILNTRKQQAGRLWFNWQTQVDQLKAGKLTTKSGNTLFKNLANIGDSRAFRKLNGLDGGQGFKEYEKINENQPNPAKVVYDKWLNQNGEDAQYIAKLADIDGWIGSAISRALLRTAYGDDAGIRKAMASAFKLGSEAMIPKCDSAKSGTPYFNCLKAGFDTSTRDINIKKLGADGKISKEDYQKLLAYAGETDRKIAAQKPLSERLTSIEGNTSFARTVLMHAVVPLQTSGSFVGFQTSLTDMVAKMPSIFGSTLSSNATADIDDETAMNNINPSGFRIETLKNSPLSATLNLSGGSPDSCPVIDGENVCKADESVFLAFQAKYDLLPEDTAQFAGGMRVASFNILHAPDGDVPARLHRSVETILSPPDGGASVDIVGFQEVRPEQLNLLKTSEYLGDQYDFFPGTTDRPEYKPNVVAWKKGGRFEVISKDFINANYFHNEPEQMPVVKFRDTVSGTQFYFASIHSPRSGNGRGDNEAVRDNNARIFAAYFANIKERESDTATILVGDFNSGYQAATNIEQIEEGRRAFCILTNGIFWDAWHAAKNVDEKCPKNSNNSNIDHIFVDRDTHVSNYFTAPRGTPDNGYNNNNGSDHPTIFADLGAALGSRDYTNPVFDGVAQDPAVIRGEDGTWHVYLNSGSENPFKHLTSKDLVHWKQAPGRTLTNNIEGTRAWAPDIEKTGDHYTIVFTGGTGQAPQDGDRWIGYATSPNAGGPFRYQGKIPGSTNGSNGTRSSLMLDPRIYTEGSQMYITYGSGELFIRKLNMSADGSLSFGGGAKSIMKNRTGTFTIEQSNVEKINGWYYLFYSAGLFSAQDGGNEYSVRVARSHDLMGPYTPDNGSHFVIKDKDGDPFDAPGTNDVVRDDGGGYWLVYNAFKGGDRRLMLDKLNFNDGWPVANDGHPSSTRQQGPLIAGLNDTNSGGSNGELAWPLEKKWFNQNRADWLGPHTGRNSTGYTGTAWGNSAAVGVSGNKGAGIGADIGDPPTGTPIYAMLTGKVISTNLCGENDGIAIKSTVNGKTVGISYMHGVLQKFSVGDTVRAGQQIMSLNAKGCSVYGAHVHIGIAYDGKYICPQDVFLAMDRGQSVDWSALTRKANVTCPGR